MQDLPVIMNDTDVAVLGAGPAGLVMARWLLHRGFEPVLFESAARLGGQWNPASTMSATWPGMRTNTSRVMTAFSDVDHEDGTPVYPRQEEMLAYLERYAARFDLHRRIRLGTRVEMLDRVEESPQRAEGTPGRWLVRSRCDGVEKAEVFHRVVVATGRYVAPEVPEVSGLSSFCGMLGVVHASQYDGADRYRGRNVVVAGCSISALEIASDLALAGARVTATYRRQRYIVPKLLAGVPTDHVLFSRATALAAEVCPPEVLAEGLRSTILRVAGNPAQYGAPAPDDDIFAAGIAQSQHFLTAVAEGRIATRPWMDRIEGRKVRFADGSACEADGILFGTGYRISLPWLAPGLASALGLDRQHIDLHDHTFHPDLPGLAFIGFYDQVGPLLPVLELQARWVAQAFAGASAAPTRAAMSEGLTRCRARRGCPQTVPMHAMALLFARHAGVEPDPARWPGLERALLFGPLSPASFRLQGPDSLPDAARRTKEAAAAFGAIVSKQFTADEQGLHDVIAAQPLAA
ncbi:MAG TPA: NAD(P)-binding domain-containing protein [Lautropia sp.]|nr:NAD(P)-binding domain-containing protein [Lautropia sp.]